MVASHWLKSRQTGGATAIIVNGLDIADIASNWGKHLTGPPPSPPGPSQASVARTATYLGERLPCPSLRRSISPYPGGAAGDAAVDSLRRGYYGSVFGNIHDEGPASHPSSTRRWQPVSVAPPDSGGRQDTRRYNKPCGTTISTRSACQDWLWHPTFDSIEPPWYATRMPGGVTARANLLYNKAHTLSVVQHSFTARPIWENCVDSRFGGAWI